MNKLYSYLGLSVIRKLQWDPLLNLLNYIEYRPRVLISSDRFNKLLCSVNVRLLVTNK